MSLSNQQQGEMIQQELPIALVRGERMVDKPKDLFIPTHALEIQVNEFEGPLDLLLYLIRKQKFDILDLPIAPITEQYFRYIESFEKQGFELAAEYLLMAATLAEIKSRLLLPKQVVEAEEADPRAELVRKLQEYELIKQAGELLEALPQLGRDIHTVSVALAGEFDIEHDEPNIGLKQLVSAFQKVLSRQAAFEHHHIQRESISTRKRITDVLNALIASNGQVLSFAQLIDTSQGRQGVIVTFLAILELIKEEKVSCEMSEDERHFGLKLVA